MYNKKSVEWAHKKEISIYRHPVLSDEEKGIKKNTKLIIRRKKYSEMNEHERTVSNKRRQSYYQRKIRYLMDLAIHNKLNLFITLTFSEKITEYEEAKYRWELFLKRLKDKYGKDIKYIATYEKQKRGAYHYHVLTNTGFLPIEELSKEWKYGYVYVEEIKAECQEDQIRQIRYVFKYIVKEVMEEMDDNINRKRKVYCSRNLFKPTVIKEITDQTVEDVIFENMEDIIENDEYDMKNFQGIKINKVDNIKIKKMR